MLGTETLDRTMLMAMLAVQGSLAPVVPVAMAVFAWISDPSRSLGALLVERGELSEADLGPLETLADRLVERHGGRAEPALAAAAAVARAEVLETLARVPDPMVQAVLARAGVAARPRGPREASGVRADAGEIGPGSALETEPRATPRYRLTGESRSSGLGSCFFAIDREFDREVVVWMLRPGFAGTDNREVAESRFLAESRVLGRFDHPGIAPVLDAGRLADGRPFFVLRPVRGTCLDCAIDDYHKPRAPAPGRALRALALRRLVGRLAAACRAVAHAHARGIIHRDLKPFNVLLGEHGETQVVEWSLACPWGPDAPWSPDEPPDVIVGSPPYLSPEQVSGRPLGPASDVFALGAILYTLLVGRPPFNHRDTGSYIEAVRAGRFPAPRAVRRDVSRPLERICLRAMSLRPEDRYPTADALADDLDLRLAGLPTSVDPARWWRRPR
jgi:hypothetical protein